MRQIVDFMDRAFKNHANPEYLAALQQEVQTMALKFPVPGL
jgi:glycine/serine hydroxymethyltransferase